MLLFCWKLQNKGAWCGVNCLFPPENGLKVPAMCVFLPDLLYLKAQFERRTPTIFFKGMTKVCAADSADGWPQFWIQKDHWTVQCWWCWCFWHIWCLRQVVVCSSRMDAAIVYLDHKMAPRTLAVDLLTESPLNSFALRTIFLTGPLRLQETSLRMLFY